MEVREYLTAEGRSPYSVNYQARRHRMPLSRSFRETVMARAQNDPEFRTEMISEATSAFLDGDIDTGKNLLRDYLNATNSMPRIARSLKKDD